MNQWVKLNNSYVNLNDVNHITLFENRKGFHIIFNNSPAFIHVCELDGEFEAWVEIFDGLILRSNLMEN